MKNKLKDIAIILLIIGIALIGFGLGWFIGEKVVYAINREICINTTNLEWFIDNNCIDYFIDKRK